MTALWWGICRKDAEQWVSTDFDFSPNPRQAKPFSTHDRATAFIRIHLGSESDHWTVKPIPAPSREVE